MKQAQGDWFSSDTSTIMIVFTPLLILILFCVLLVFQNAGLRQRIVFGQVVLNMHAWVRVYPPEHMDIKKRLLFCFDLEGVKDL